MCLLLAGGTPYLASVGPAPIRIIPPVARATVLLPPLEWEETESAELPAEPVPHEKKLPEGEKFSETIQAEPSSMASHQANFPPPIVILATPIEVNTTPQMLIPFFKNQGQASNTNSMVVLPVGFQPPVAPSSGSSRATYTQPEKQ